jgi:hypothetical protein
MNIMGIDERDDPATPHVRENFFARYVSSEDLDSFGGWKPRRKAFSAEGELGKTIREEFEMMAVVPAPWEGDGGVKTLPPLSSPATLVLHAGISSKLAKQYDSVAQMNQEARAALQASLEGDDSKLRSDLFNEVLQTRHLVHNKESKACAELKKTLAHLGAARLVVGHTPQESRRALVRCEGRFVVLDVAMSRWLMDMRRPEKMTHPVALELSYNDVNDGEAKVTGLRIIYRDTVEDLTPKNVEL